MASDERENKNEEWRAKNTLNPQHATGNRMADMKRAVFAGVVILCGMQGLWAQTRVNGVLLPQEERFSASARVPKYGELEQQLLEKIRSRAEGLRLDEALEDRTLVTAVLAWTVWRRAIRNTRSFSGPSSPMRSG